MFSSIEENSQYFVDKVYVYLKQHFYALLTLSNYKHFVIYNRIQISMAEENIDGGNELTD